MINGYVKIFAAAVIATGVIAAVNMRPASEKPETTPELLKKDICSPLSASFAKAPLQKVDPNNCPTSEGAEKSRSKVRVIKIEASAP